MMARQRMNGQPDGQPEYVMMAAEA